MLAGLGRLRTTPLGAVRIKRNLGLDTALSEEAVVMWCKEKIKAADEITRQGKNWYARAGGAVITINAHSFTVITAHKMKAKP